MKILHFSSTDITGGAARSAYRLHSALRKHEIDSTMFVGGKASDDFSIFQYQPENGLLPRLRRMIRKERLQRAFNRYAATRPAGFEHFHDDRSEFGSEPIRQIPGAEIFHLHWISTFLDFQNFFDKCDSETPIVWTLHDMHPFTGGCHFDDSCGRFSETCGKCPQLGSSKSNDLSHQIWLRKKKTLEKFSPERLHFVAPSRWLAAEARQSSLLRKFSIHLIPYGIDTDLFSPNPAARKMREVLEIPESAKIILFLAEYVGNRRKGFHFLDKALTRLQKSENIFLLSIGNGKPKPTADLPHLHLGPIANDRLLATIYNLADLFVIPSIQDNLPNTVLESIACGTPVVGFNTGGIPDMVQNGENGFLVPVGNTIALAQAILKAVEPNILKKMSLKSREIALEKFREEIQAERYLQFYRKISGKTDLPEIKKAALSNPASLT